MFLFIFYVVYLSGYALFAVRCPLLRWRGAHTGPQHIGVTCAGRGTPSGGGTRPDELSIQEVGDELPISRILGNSHCPWLTYHSMHLIMTRALKIYLFLFFDGCPSHYHLHGVECQWGRSCRINHSPIMRTAWGSGLCCLPLVLFWTFS